MAEAHDALRRDPELGRLIDEHGEIELEPHPDPFERLVRTIISQQLSGASASAIRGRVFDRFEITPEGLLAADPDALREAGLSRQKVEYVKNIADRFADGGLSRSAFEAMSDDEIIDELTTIRGVGVWTGKMFLISVMAREDVFPVEDLGIRRGVEALYGLTEREAMVEKAEDWRPYRSYASRYLWRAVDD